MAGRLSVGNHGWIFVVIIEVIYVDVNASTLNCWTKFLDILWEITRGIYCRTLGRNAGWFPREVSGKISGGIPEWIPFLKPLQVP